MYNSSFNLINFLENCDNKENNKSYFTIGQENSVEGKIFLVFYIFLEMAGKNINTINQLIKQVKKDIGHHKTIKFAK